MEKRKSLLIGILIVIVVAIALVLIDSTLPLHSEVQANENNERLNYFERKKSSAKTPQENEYMLLQPEDLMLDGKFQYGKQLKWNRSYLTAKANWAYELSPVALKEYAFRELACIRSKSSRILGDIRGDTLFYFQNNGGDFVQESQLKAIAFRFSLEDVENDSDWYQTQYDTLVQLYGPEIQSSETFSEELQLTTRLCRWTAEETTLELLLQTGQDTPPVVTIRISTE